MSGMIASLVLTVFSFLGFLFYTPWRISKLFGIKKEKYGYLLSSIVVLVAGVSISFVSKYNSVYIDGVYLVFTSLLGILFYLFVFSLVYEVVRLFVKIPNKTAGIGIIGLALLVSLYGLVQGYRYEVKTIDIYMDKLKQNARVAILADIQMGGHRGKSYLERVIEDINKGTPDVVLIPGDLADSNAILELDNFKALRTLEAPTYFITGNHDTYVELPKLINILNENNVRVLNNEVVEVAGVNLVGLKYMNADDEVFEMHPSTETDTIASSLPTLEINQNLPVVVMHHSPVGVEYIKEFGTDLYIAGHTHGGGQIFPATVLAKMFFYEFANGLYDLGKLKVFVSPGVGTFMVPMRVGTQNEITFLDLHPANQGE